jgi:hypothetical protein
MEPTHYIDFTKKCDKSSKNIVIQPINIEI